MIRTKRNRGGFAYRGPWAGRPAANGVPVGTKLAITDVGVGGYSEWFSDGTYWRPVGGFLMLGSWVSARDTPLSVITGVTGIQEFPGVPRILIPEGVVAPNTVFRMRARESKRGTTLGASLDCRLTSVLGSPISGALGIGGQTVSATSVYAAQEVECGVDSANLSMIRSGWAFASGATASTVMLADNAHLRIGQAFEFIAGGALLSAADFLDLQMFQVCMEG